MKDDLRSAYLEQVSEARSNGGCSPRTSSLLSSSSPHYISKLWLHKLKHFGEPGPIDQSSFLCAHNLVQPHQWPHVDALALACSSQTWSYLVDTFGVRFSGSEPPCTRLRPCAECQRRQEALHQRQVREKFDFIRLRDKWNQQQQQQHPQHVSRVFAVSPGWFKQWEQFVQQQNPVWIVDVPSKIDNHSICLKPPANTSQPTSQPATGKKKKQQSTVSTPVNFQLNPSNN